MFAIPWNFPFRKKDGSISTIGDEMGSGGGSTYTLPTASTDTKGGVKVGAGLTMDGEVLKNTNPTAYTLPTASDSVLGGVKIGSGITIDENGVISTSGGGGGSSLNYVDIPLSSFSVNSGTQRLYYSNPPEGLDPTKIISAVKMGGSADVHVMGIDLSNNTSEGLIYVVLYNANQSSVNFTGTIRVWYNS